MSGNDVGDLRPISTTPEHTQQLELAVRRAIAHLESLSASRATTAAVPLPVTLSGRRRQVAALAVQGTPTEQIAVELGLSPNTVRNHLKAVCRILGLRSRAELLARYHA
jgi:DNA-binding CsgD family transcriptional regulator